MESRTLGMGIKTEKVGVTELDNAYKSPYFSSFRQLLIERDGERSYQSADGPSRR